MLPRALVDTQRCESHQNRNGPAEVTEGFSMSALPALLHPERIAGAFAPREVLLEVEGVTAKIPSRAMQVLRAIVSISELLARSRCWPTSQRICEVPAQCRAPPFAAEAQGRAREARQHRAGHALLAQGKIMKTNGGDSGNGCRLARHSDPGLSLPCPRCRLFQPRAYASLET